MEIKRDILWRVYLSFIGIIILSILVLGKAVYIQRFQGAYWRSMSDSLHQRFVTLEAERGTIFSEDGQMLSISIPSFDIYIDFNADGLREKRGKRFIENVDSFSSAMARFFQDKSAEAYKKEFWNAFRKKDRYYLLKKKLNFESYKAFRSFPLVRLGRNKSGVIVEVNSKRETPFGLLANRTIGLSREFTTADHKIKKQNVGLEKSYDTVLSGHAGQKLVRFIAGGAAIPVAGSETDPINGKDIFTTIDVSIQEITETALMKAMIQCEGPYGTAIVMETATGKIKAIANLGRRSDGSYWEDDNYALRNTEPGSTFKLVTLLSVLDKGTSTITDKVEVGSAGRLQVIPGRVVVDAERSPSSVMSVRDCFVHSSNVGMSKLALKAFGQKPALFKEYFHRFQMDMPSPIDLANVSRPTTATLSTKNGESGLGNMLWMSFGYGVQVSPLHTLTLYNAVANGGRMMKPYLVNSISNNGIITKKFEPVVLSEQLSKPEVIRQVREAMELVVKEGTGRKAFAGMPFGVAGKTGTAHVSDGSIKYGHGVYQATFAGYFPADKPQYTCIVLIRTKPHAPSHYGGSLAAPVFREIALKLHAMYVEQKSPLLIASKADSIQVHYSGNATSIRNVYRALNMNMNDSSEENQWVHVQAAERSAIMRKANVLPDRMPNVSGMGLKDALYLLERMGLKVRVQGKGKIAGQSVAPGTIVQKGNAVVLELAGKS